MQTAIVEMIGFKDDLAKYFTELNLAWVKKYFTVEPMDQKILSDPKTNIIDKEGHIYFATVDAEIAGTFALLKIDDSIYELSKMAVAENMQGKNIGNVMMKFCIEEAQRMNISKLILYSNTKLKPAIHLYEKYGFKEVPLENSEYKRSNIKMENNFK
jgi:ribosomal protein S18 acetylase RimI-like enzyme